MKRLLAVLLWSTVSVGHGALLPTRGTVKQPAFLARRDGEHSTGLQPWLYNPPPATVPRAKPLSIPGDPLVLPPVDKLWDMQPSASPPTIEPPKEGEKVGLQATVPPRTLEGWYATISPQAIEDGTVDNRTAYYVRCLGGPWPCPQTVPPAVLRYWVPVPQMAFVNAEASTSLSVATNNYPFSTNVLTVDTSVGFQVGRVIKLDAGTAIEEANTIVGFGNLQLILQFPTKYAHKAGVLITMPTVASLVPTPAPTTANPMAMYMTTTRPMFGMNPMYAQPFTPYNPQAASLPVFQPGR